MPEATGSMSCLPLSGARASVWQTSATSFPPHLASQGQKRWVTVGSPRSLGDLCTCAHVISAWSCL